MASLTQADMEFMRTNQVALRFQHTPFHQAFKRDGAIRGDAYSLGYKGPWGDDPAKMQAAIRTVTASVFESNVGSTSDEGTFVLLKDVPGASRPVTDRTYQTLYPVGAFTQFKTDQVIGEVPVNHQDLTKGTQRDSRDYDSRHAVADYLTDKIVQRIQEAHAASLVAGLQKDVGARGHRRGGYGTLRSGHAETPTDAKGKATRLPGKTNFQPDS